MNDQAWIHEVVGRVASEVLESRVAELRDELVRLALEEVQPALASGSVGSEKLLAAVAQVQASSGQRDILHTLLDQSAGFCARSVLFVVKPESVTGWQALGFADDDAVRDFALDVNTPLLQHVLANREPATVDSGRMDAHFLSSFGAPVNDECHLLPLFLKEKIAAVLYADAGSANASCERAALDLLVRFTSLWLEAQASRKSSQTGESGEEPTRAEAVATQSPAAAAKAAAAGLSADAPEWTQAATPASAVMRQEHHQEAGTKPRVAPAGFAASAAAPAMEKSTGTAPAEPMSVADAETHKKAQRFARLLIDEIKLYNKAKLEEGFKQHDLYDRMRDDIDKSRATYGKRYGSTVAVSEDYFVQELIRGLAQGDASLLGPNFRR